MSLRASSAPLLAVYAAVAITFVAGCEAEIVTRRPVAVCNGDQTGPLNLPVELDGSGSYVPGRTDPSLGYEWAVVVSPAEATGEALPVIEDRGAERARFIAKAPGLYTLRLVVSHEGVDSRPAFMNVRSFRLNDPPVVVCGAVTREVEPAEAVSLDCSDSHDPEGKSISFSWRQIEGEPVTLTPEGSLLTFTAPRAAQTLRFGLTVTDNKGAAAEESILTVQVLDVPPVARITGPLQADESTSVRLDGTGSSDDNLDDITTYAWTQVSGPPIQFDDPTRSAPTFGIPRFSGPDTRVVVALKVTAADVESDEVTHAIRLNDTINEPPVAEAGPDASVDEQAQASLDGTGSVDPNGDSISFEWVQLAGPVPLVLSDTTSATPTFDAPVVFQDTTWSFQVTVTDINQLAHTDAVEITVQNSVNEPPRATATAPARAQVVSQVQLGGSAVDDNDDALTYAWTQTLGDTVSLSDPTAIDPVFVAPSTPQVLEFALEAHDGMDPSAPATVSVRIDPGPADPGTSTLAVADTVLVADGADATTVTVRVRDAAGNLLAGKPVVIFTTAGALEGPVVDVGDGSYTQTLRAPTLVGEATLSFTVGGVAGQQTAGVTFVPGPPTGTFALSAVPLSVVADGTSSAQITSAALRDAFGNVVADQELVTVSSSHGTLLATDVDSAVPGVQLQTSAGIVTFGLRSSTEAVTADVQAASVRGDATGSVQIPFDPGAPSGTIPMTAADTTLTADGASGTTVTGGPVLDAQGNVVDDGTRVRIWVDGGEVAPGQDLDLGTVEVEVETTGGTFTAAVVAGTVAGPMVVHAATVQGNANGSVQVSLVPGAPAGTIVLAASPAAIVADTSTVATVTSEVIVDAFGNVVADGTLVTVSSNRGTTFDTPDADPATPGQQVATVGGVVTFAVRSGTLAGTATVTAAAATATGSTTFQLLPGPAAQIALVSGSNQTGVVGAPLAQPFVVEVTDANGNVVPGFTVTWASVAGGGSVAPTSTATDAAGRAEAVGTLGTASHVSNRFQAAGAGLVGSPLDFLAQSLPGPAHHLEVSGIPGSVQAGQSQSVTVQARDAFGNLAEGYRGTVRFASSDPQSILPPNYTFTGADSGAHVFTAGVTFRTVGSQEVVATDTVTATIYGLQSNIVVTPGPAASLRVTGLSNTFVAGTAGDLQVEALDAFGNRATGYTGQVHFTSDDPQAELPADYTFTAGDAGVRVLANSVVLKTVGVRSVTATDTVAPSITGTRAGVQVIASDAVVLLVSGVPSPTTAGVGRSVTVEARDAYGNRATGYRGTVHFTTDDAQGDVPADYTFTAGDSGQHVFGGGVRLRTAGTWFVRATDTSDGTLFGAQSGIEVTPAAAATLVVTGITSPRTAGTTGTVTVRADDAFGNRATGYRGTIRFTSDDTRSTLPADYTFTVGDAGEHTFTGAVVLATAGTRWVRAADMVGATIAGQQSGIVVNPAAADRLVVTSAAAATAGVAQDVTVEAQDAYGNVATGYRGAVHFASTDTQATVPADYVFTGVDAGRHVFPAGVTFRTAGSRDLTATDTVAAGITGSVSVLVHPASAATIAVSGISATATAGTPETVALEVFDAFGNRATGYTGTVHFETDDPQGVLPVNYTFTAADQGQHSFPGGVTLATVGTRSVSATDTVRPTVTGSQSGIVVEPGSASLLVVWNVPSPIVAGTAAGVSVEARDAYGNKATGYRGQVGFTSSDAQATLPPPYAFTAGDAGLHVFSGALTLKTAGLQSVTARDTATPSIAGSQTGIQVDAAPADSLVLSLASPVTAGAPQDATLEARDAFGNRASGYLGTVHFTTTDPAGSVPTDYTFTGVDAGRHVFGGGVVLQTAGNRDVVVTDTASAALTDTATVLVQPAAAASLVVSGIPSPVVAGTEASVTIEALDAYGNRATGYTGTIRFTTSDPLGELPADYTFTGAEGGLHTLSGVVLKRVGSHWVRATDTSAAALTGDQSSIQVQPGPVTALAVEAPASFTAGVAGDVTVEAQDAYGNRASGYTGTVHFTTTDPAGTVPADYTFAVSDGGRLTFWSGLELVTAGSQTVVATDTGNASITGQTEVEVQAAGATLLLLSGIGTPTAAGVAQDVTVELTDGFGNRATGYTGTVHFTATDPSATLPVDYAFTATDAGLRTFTGVVFQTVGTHTVTASDTVTAALTGSQAGIEVTAGPAASFALSGVPSPVTAGTASDLTVEVLDAYGNRATAYTGMVTFSSTDAAAVLPGAFSFTGADGGLHTFSGEVSLRTGGSQTVTATDAVSAGLTGELTAEVVPAAFAALQVSGIASPVVAGASGSVTVEAVDAYGNRTTDYTGTVTFTSTDPAATLPGDQAFTAGDAGMRVFAGLVFRTAGIQSVTANDEAAGVTGSQTGVVVQPASAATLLVSGIPATVQAAAAVDVTVEAQDAYGNLATGYTGTVTFSSTDSAATLPADYAFTAGDAGQHTFTGGVVFATAGTWSVTASDSVASLTGVQTGIVVEANAAPTAVAGADALGRLPLDTVILDGTGSTDPEGGTLTYLWEVTAAPTGSVATFGPSWPGAITGTEAIVSFWPDLPGDYTVSLTVTDPDSNTGSDALLVRVHGFADETGATGDQAFVHDLAVLPDGTVGIAAKLDAAVWDPTNGWQQTGCRTGVVGRSVVASGSTLYFGYEANAVDPWTTAGCGTALSLPGGRAKVWDMATRGLNGEVWLASDKDLLFLSGGVFSAPQSFTAIGPNKEYLALGFSDAQDDLFAAPSSGYFHTPMPFDTATTQQWFSADNESVVDVTEGSGDEMWFATPGKGLWRLPDLVNDPTIYESFKVTDGVLTSDDVRRIAYDPGSGDVWVVSANELVRYKADEDVLVVVPGAAVCTAGGYTAVAMDYDFAAGRRNVVLGCNTGLWVTRYIP